MASVTLTGTDRTTLTLSGGDDTINVGARITSVTGIIRDAGNANAGTDALAGYTSGTPTVHYPAGGTVPLFGANTTGPRPSVIMIKGTLNEVVHLASFAMGDV